jgi:hypothetical protein
MTRALLRRSGSDLVVHTNGLVRRWHPGPGRVVESKYVDGCCLGQRFRLVFSYSPRL